MLNVWTENSDLLEIVESSLQDGKGGVKNHGRGSTRPTQVDGGLSPPNRSASLWEEWTISDGEGAGDKYFRRSSRARRKNEKGEHP